MSTSPSPDPVSPDPSPSPEKEVDVDETAETPRSGSSSAEAEANTASGAEPTPASSSTSAAPSTPSSATWQALWSPAHSAYYFYNSVTHETTWVNPLQSSAASGESAPSSTPSTSASTSTSAPATAADNPDAQEDGPSSTSPSSSGATPVPASIAQIYALQEAAAAQGIDPSLAYLDPSLAGGPPVPGGSGAYNFSAKFNAHTGAFARPDGRDPTHLSEYERMKRMSSVYFNMEQWEQDVAQRKEREDEDAANGKKRKRPTKKDLVGRAFLLVL